MKHSFPTIAIPFPEANADAVDAELDKLGNPAAPFVRDALRNRGIHFMSMSVLRGGAEHRTYLLLEASGDGNEDDVRGAIAEHLGELVGAVLQAAGVDAAAGLNAFFHRNSVSVGQSLFSTPGLCFAGTPGMSVARIRDEYRLARRVREILETDDISGSSLQILQDVRGRIASDPNFNAMLVPEPTPLLQPACMESLPIARLIVAGLWTFAWPYLLAAVLATVAATILRTRAAGWLPGLAAGFLTLLLGIVGLIGIAAFVYARLRRMERSDPVDDSAPNATILAEIARRENRTAQNHLGGPTPLKAGYLRRYLLRIAFWVIQRVAAHTSRPGFLGDLGTIHFARWVLLPGTNKLMFFSNYGGSWESYLEDFITQAHGGLTGVWSNTVGFPRTKNLFQDGAVDGGRFKRWARRHQAPTRFWYSAYPHLTTARIRLNTALRHGLASASTEDEAAAWLSCVGSRPRGRAFLEVNEIQTILFGGLKPLTHACCLLLRLPADIEGAKSWLAELAPSITFGDGPPADSARLVVFTQSGLRRLGCNDQIIEEFPIAFQEGMSAAHRAALLGDTGDDKPESWWWGHGERAVDAALLVYSKTSEALDAEIALRLSRIESFGGTCVHRVLLQPIDPHVRTREPFGFVDGVSQPIVRGTRRWVSDADAMHVVEPGEFLLGYPDDRGFLPNTPRVPATADPHNVLPVAWHELPDGPLPNFAVIGPNRPRDLGRNGTFFVIRQLEQDVESFESFISTTAARLVGAHGTPAGLSEPQLAEWLAAKIVGRWRDGTSLVRYPHHPGTGWNGERSEVEPDNSFLLGAEDPLGHRCPFGAHIRRSNPRESFTPGSSDQLAITNRHRVLRVGRVYASPSGSGGKSKPGLLFMCVNADIERQFEFIQQTWAMSPFFHGLDGEVDSILGRGLLSGRLTIPTPEGPILVSGVKDFVTVRGGGYFFMPSRSALRFLSGREPLRRPSWKVTNVQA